MTGLHSLHTSWSGETVLVNTDTATGDDPLAVVSLTEPVADFDRGKGVTHRAKLLFSQAQEVQKNGFFYIRGERWSVDTARKPEDGGRIWYALKHEKQFTAAKSGGYGGGS